MSPLQQKPVVKSDCVDLCWIHSKDCLGPERIAWITVTHWHVNPVGQVMNAPSVHERGI